MFKGRPNKAFRKNRGTNGGAASKAPLKGLFSDGIWKCNCDPRLPASHFQTKNGGKNHGRWFYTCQHPQPRRCDFFLWDDEAKGREAAAVLNNSRSEPVLLLEEEGSSITTPTRRLTTTTTAYNGGLPTPQTERRGVGGTTLDDNYDVRTPYTPSKPPLPPSVRAVQTPTPGKSHYVDSRRNPSQATTTAGSSDDEREEFFDWPASDDEAMGKAADQVASKGSSLGNNKEYMPMPPPETPRKVQKVDAMSTPGKRKRDEMGFDNVTSRVEATTGLMTPVTASRGGGGDDVFTTPATSTRQGNLLFGTGATATATVADTTPTPIRYYKDLPASADSELATEILESLQTSLSAPLFSEAREKVKAICNRHVMYTKGIMKGRDVSRAMVKKKEEQLVALQGELDGLRSERETDRAVIRHLRRELATRGATEGR